MLKNIKKEEEMRKTKNLKKYELLKKSGSKVFLSKSNVTIPMYDLLIEIDFFLDRVKKSDLPDEEKAKILKGFKKMVVNISDTFEKLSSRYDIPFNEPFDVAMFRDDLGLKKQ